MAMLHAMVTPPLELPIFDPDDHPIPDRLISVEELRRTEDDGSTGQASASTTNSLFDVVAAQIGAQSPKPDHEATSLYRRALSLPGRVSEQYKDEVDVRWCAANDLRIIVLAAGWLGDNPRLRAI
jgi:hypothetical protein